MCIERVNYGELWFRIVGLLKALAFGIFEVIWR